MPMCGGQSPRRDAAEGKGSPRVKIDPKLTLQIDRRERWRYNKLVSSPDAHRTWRSEALAGPETFHPPGKRFLYRGAAGAHDPMAIYETGWKPHANVPYNSTAPRQHTTDIACKVAWQRKAGKDHLSLLHAPRLIRKDREVSISAVLGATKRSRNALQKSVRRMQVNRDAVIELIWQEHRSLEEATQRLLGARQHLLQAVNQDFNALIARTRRMDIERREQLTNLGVGLKTFEEHSEKAREYREEHLVWLKNHFKVLEERDPARFPDEETMFESVRHHWSELENLCAGLKEDMSMADAAIKRYWPGVTGLALHVQDERNMVLQAVQPYFKTHMEDKADPETYGVNAIIDLAMQEGVYLEELARRLRETRDRLCQSVQQDWSVFQNGIEVMRTDFAIVTAAQNKTVGIGTL